MVQRLLLALLLLPVTATVWAQADPTLLTVGDTVVKRSEFVQAYRTYCSETGEEPCEVDDFLEVYVNNRLKVMAAKAARMDTTAAFRRLLATAARQCRAVQQKSDSVYGPSDADFRRIAQCHQADDEVVSLSQIFLKVHQRGYRDELQQAGKRADSVYQVLQQGGDFASLARRVSQDETSAAHGGLMGWYGRNQLLKEMENEAFALQRGTYSRPFLAADGYHILLLNDRQTVETFPGLEQWQASEQARQQLVYSVSVSSRDAGVATAGQRPDVKREVPQTVAAQLPVDKAIYEGLLLQVLSEQSPARQAAADETAMARYFKKHKKKYRRKGFKPKHYTEVKEQVARDLYVEMEKHWIDDLKEQYPVTINKKVFKTIKQTSLK